MPTALVAVLQAILIFAVPALILRFRDRPLTRLFGTIGMAYFWGLLLAAAVWLLGVCGVPFSLVADVGEIGSYVAVGVAIPLLLFSCSLSEVRRLTRPVLVSFGALIVSVLSVATLVWAIGFRSFEWSAFLAAMSVGLYTGGTPNFISIGLAGGAGFELIAIGNLADMLIGGVFYIFLLLLAKPLLTRLLGPGREEKLYLRGTDKAENVDEISFRFGRPILRNILLALGCAVVGAGVGVLIWLIKGRVDGTLTAYLVPGVMITVTVLGIALSFVPKVKTVKENTAVGQYLILVFSFSLASCLDLSRLTAGFLPVFLFLGLVTVLSFVIHAVLCRLFHIGADCMLVTLTAGLYGPAFVPAITKQIGNDDLTAPGLICGSLGYAGGTLLGLALLALLRL